VDPLEGGVCPLPPLPKGDMGGRGVHHRERGGYISTMSMMVMVPEGGHKWSHQVLMGSTMDNPLGVGPQGSPETTRRS
jgi:hypothetical protein